MKKHNLAKLFKNARGNWGHKGRPGQVGGSAPGGGTYHSNPFSPIPKRKTDFKPAPKAKIKKVTISNDNINDIAREILTSAQGAFDFNLSEASSDEWDDITAYMDKYIKKHYIVSDEMKSALDDALGIELENDELGYHF